MQYRNFKEDSLSLLGFGLMRLPQTKDGGPIDEKTAASMVDYALNHGVNYFDTAWPYMNGESEPFIGKALRGKPRDSYYLATKMPTWFLESATDAERYFDDQLKRCQVDYFDYYLLHNYELERAEKCAQFGLFELMKKKQQEGKIRHLGFSIHDGFEAMQKVTAMHDWEFIQLQINYMDWDMTYMQKQYDHARAAGLPVIIMEPVRGGVLASLEGSAAEALAAVRPGESQAAWALNFCASLEGVITILSGMTAPRQLEENVEILSHPWQFSEHDYAAVQKAAAEYQKSGAVQCTGCNYCMDCPEGVDIPKMLAIYNDYLRHNVGISFLTAYYAMGEGKQSYYCTGCGQCLDLCPQKLPIPDHMRDIKKLVEKLDV